jgi:predicted metal-binding membrane protein
MQSARAASLPIAIPAAIAAAWCIAIAAQATGSAVFLHHDALIERGPAPAIALVLFVAAWLVMIAAMMLPSSLPFMRMFAQASANQPRSALILAAFLSGYVIVWVAFGVVAFAGDVVLHRLVDSVAWLSARPWLVSGGVLAVAGAFQFTRLKDACLRACRLPSNFLVRYYRRGARAAFGMGYRHGAFCVGCCWALMLVSFAAGFANLWWMAALTALMVFEKVAYRGRAAVPIAGAVLLAWSALIFAHPSWLPAALSGLRASG